MNFKNTIPSSSKSDLDKNLIFLLEALEVFIGKELHITSGFRSQDYEVRMGRSGLSAHCFGKAVDIYTYDSSVRFNILKFCFLKNITRIGIYKNFIHLDICTSADGKTTNIVWYG